MKGVIDTTAFEELTRLRKEGLEVIIPLPPTDYLQEKWLT
jgi:hypothetical protein